MKAKSEGTKSAGSGKHHIQRDAKGRFTSSKVGDGKSASHAPKHHAKSSATSSHSAKSASRKNS